MFLLFLSFHCFVVAAILSVFFLFGFSRIWSRKGEWVHGILSRNSTLTSHHSPFTVSSLQSPHFSRFLLYRSKLRLRQIIEVDVVSKAYLYGWSCYRRCYCYPWPTPRQGTPRRWLAGNGWFRRGARRPPSPSMATPFTASCIRSQLIFRPWLTLTSSSSSSPCLSNGDLAHCPCSNSGHSPTPGSLMAQSHPQQPLRPSNSHYRRWSLPLVAVAVAAFLFIKISVQQQRRRCDQQRRPWLRRRERQQK